MKGQYGGLKSERISGWLGAVTVTEHEDKEAKRRWVLTGLPGRLKTLQYTALHLLSVQPSSVAF